MEYENSPNGVQKKPLQLKNKPLKSPYFASEKHTNLRFSTFERSKERE